MTAKTYRPYLTLQELNTLLTLLASHPGQSALHFKLFKLKTEAELGLKKADYTLKPSLLDKLVGIKPSGIQPSQELWNAYKDKPAFLSPAQIKAAKQYGWENQLMQPQELQDYMKEIGLS